MTGKLFALIIIVAAAIAGGAVYYLQVYAFYQEVGATGPGDVTLLPQGGTTPQPIAHSGFQAIDADSSPIRYRACFTTDVGLDELRATFVAAADKDPRNAPGWFDCFDAGLVGAALEDGTAETFIGVKNIDYGVDRIVAITEDGRGFVWHDLNDCGHKDYDGTVTGETCPPKPETGNGN